MKNKFNINKIKKNLEKESYKALENEFKKLLTPFIKEINDSNGKIQYDKVSQSFKVTGINDDLKNKINQFLTER